MFGLSAAEYRTLKKLNTPIKIQDFLDTFPINWEKNGETYMSPQRVLREKKMHCLEGALLAAAALWIGGEPPLVLDFQNKGDDDHVIALYKRNGHWGAISKTNHVTLRYRDPVYKTIRELAMSYFHEYWRVKDGKKTFVAYSARPFNLKQFGTTWITASEELQHIVDAIDEAPHEPVCPKKNFRWLRYADKMEMRAGKLIEWKKSDRRT